MKHFRKFVVACAMTGASAFLPSASTNAATVTLLSTDFQDDSSQGWEPGGKGSVSLFNYQGNWSIRISENGEVTNSVRIEGVSHVALQASFAAYHLDLSGRDKCVAEYSIDDGANWTPFSTLRLSQGDSLHLHAGHVSDVDVSSTKLLLLRLRAQLSMHEAACFADDISVTGESTTP